MEDSDHSGFTVSASSWSSSERPQPLPVREAAGGSRSVAAIYTALLRFSSSSPLLPSDVILLPPPLSNFLRSMRAKIHCSESFASPPFRNDRSLQNTTSSSTLSFFPPLPPQSHGFSPRGGETALLSCATCCPLSSDILPLPPLPLPRLESRRKHRWIMTDPEYSGFVASTSNSTSSRLSSNINLLLPPQARPRSSPGLVVRIAGIVMDLDRSIPTA